jgi:phytoene dehydrogenase-like protein
MKSSISAARTAGTRHLGGGMDHLVRFADANRSPAAMGIYPRAPTVAVEPISGITGAWDAAEGDAIAACIEEVVRRMAPGFRSPIAGRHVSTPRSLETDDANLLGGGVSERTAQLHQELVTRLITAHIEPREYWRHRRR